MKKFDCNCIFKAIALEMLSLATTPEEKSSINIMISSHFTEQELASTAVPKLFPSLTDERQREILVSILENDVPELISMY